MPPLPFGRPTTHRNYLPETLPWSVDLDIRLELIVKGNLCTPQLPFGGLHPIETVYLRLSFGL